MPETNIGSADYGDFKNSGTNYSVPSVVTDAADGNQKETEWINPRFGEFLGYYKKIPELMAAIDAKATWTIGKGFIADTLTTFIIQQVRGFGKDTFNSILENAIRTYHIGGDAFVEIIRDSDGNFINLKPLDPSSIKIVASKKGMIVRYEQVSKGIVPNLKFMPEQILHLSRKRVADEIHGISLIAAVEDIILMRNEAMADYKKLLHRNIFPVRVWHLDSDDTTKIAEFKAKAVAAKYQGEDIFIPKGAVETELAAVPGNATLNPLPWINVLNQYFFQATGVPQIIVGGSQEMTEATAKIAYLAFEQTIDEEQLGMQLGLAIELEFPASLENELLTDKGKSETMQAATPEDTSAVPAEV